MLLFLSYGAFSQDLTDLHGPSASSATYAYETGAYETVKVVGKALVGVNGEYSTLHAGRIVQHGYTIQTYGESSVSIKGNDRYYLIHANTRVKIDRKPLLINGKLSGSSSANFVDLHFSFSPNPGQGKTLNVQVWSRNGDIEIDSHIDNEKGYRKRLTFYPLKEGAYRALTGFDRAAPPVKYRLEIRAEAKDDYTYIIYPFWLRAIQYGKGKVVLSKGKNSLLAPSEQKKKEQHVLSEILARSTGRALWSGAFSYPIENPIVLSQFGKERVYYIETRRVFTRYHRGIDFKGKRGDSVLAPNRGIVVFADMRISTGNTVVLDHGQAVFSLFFHLDTIDTTVGEEVAKGERVGGLGSTGIAEGDHLHWSLFVDGVYVDPNDWVMRAF